MSNLFEQYQQAMKLLDMIEDRIADAVGRVLQHQFGYDLNKGTYYYPGAKDGEMGYLKDAIIDKDWIVVLWATEENRYNDEINIEIAIADIISELK